MTLQPFREPLARRPFSPVRRLMSSGQTDDVRHPETALLTRTSLLVGIDIADDGGPPEFKMGSLWHVTAIEPTSANSAGPQSAN